jgi:hypothetical protein
LAEKEFFKSPLVKPVAGSQVQSRKTDEFFVRKKQDIPNEVRHTMFVWPKPFKSDGE